MDLQDELSALEEQFWKGDADFFRRHLIDDALLVLPPPAGLMTKAMTVRSIGESSRWSEVTLREVNVLELSDGVALLTYRATARREAAGPRYTARVSSAFVRRDGEWKLAFHQQTPER
jgi:hypothetical protein